jgi:toxin-antitoxin system PIN domain toxin
VVALLDVSVLIALFNPDHVHHEAAHDWFSDSRAGGWATCPVTENGLVRILSNPAATPSAERPAAIRERLRMFCESGNHTFWPDAVSIRDARLFRHPLPVGFRQVTDVYLLALAVYHGGLLATFDRQIPVAAVTGATSSHLIVIAA